MTEQSFREWLENYLRPQEKRNADKIKDLFAPDGVYWWGPFYEPRHGAAAIYEHHRNALSHQTGLVYRYEILAVTESCGVARFHLVLDELMPGEPTEYDGIFLVHLDDNNRCTLFEEWYHGRMRQAASTPEFEGSAPQGRQEER
jgi:hypothetical protein